MDRFYLFSCYGRCCWVAELNRRSEQQFELFIEELEQKMDWYRDIEALFHYFHLIMLMVIIYAENMM